jgi:polyhydroxybutyrate depolymerase
MALSARLRMLASLAGGLSIALPAYAAAPKTTGSFTRNVGTIAGRERVFVTYVPQNLKPQAPLVFVFHGGGGDGPTARKDFGYEFDMLADRHGFVVVYPDGISRSWNNCRRRPNVAAKRMKVDDVAFVEAMIAQEAAVHGIDRKRVFATGHSNGGSLAYRLAMERPAMFAGIAAVSSNLPDDDNNDCEAKNVAMPVMIMNGTADPVSRYEGGRTVRNGSDQGTTLSTGDTARYWARVNGLPDTPEKTRLPHANASDQTSVDLETWSASGKPSVLLYTINGGGHVVPQPYFRFPTQLGLQTQDLDAPSVIWDFFANLPSR